eukprot:gene10818-3436_t
MSKYKTCFIVQDYTQKQHDELSVKRGDIVKVTIKYQTRHKVTNSVGKIGWIPSNLISNIEIKESTIINNVATPFEKLLVISRMRKRRKQLAKKAINRQNIVNEIIETEQTYVESLSMILKWKEIIVNSKFSNNFEKQIEIIFGQIPAMFDVNRTLYKHLTESQFSTDELTSAFNILSNSKSGSSSGTTTPVSSGSSNNSGFLSHFLSKKKNKINKSTTTPTTPTTKTTNILKETKKLTFGESFKKISPLLRLYTVYINGYPKSNEALKIMTKDDTFSIFLTNIRKNDSQFKGFDLSTLLITPIQRLPRYGLLLEQLVKNTPEFHYDYKNLIDSYSLIKDITGELNEKRNIFESQKRIVELTSRFPLFNAETESDSGVKHRLMLQHRRYVNQEEFYVKSILNFWIKCDLFLYSDILLIGESQSDDKKILSERQSNDRTSGGVGVGTGTGTGVSVGSTSGGGGGVGTGTGIGTSNDSINNRGSSTNKKTKLKLRLSPQDGDYDEYDEYDDNDITGSSNLKLKNITNSTSSKKNNHFLREKINFPNLYLHFGFCKECKQGENEEIFILKFLDKEYEIKEIKKGTSLKWIEDINDLIKKDLNDLKKEKEINIDLNDILKEKEKIKRQREDEILKMNQEFKSLIENYSKVFTMLNFEEDLIDDDLVKYLRNDSRFMKEHFDQKLNPASKLNLSCVTNLTKNVNLSEKEVESFSKSFSFNNEKLIKRKEKFKEANSKSLNDLNPHLITISKEENNTVDIITNNSKRKSPNKK